jgi:hypothetical protein
MSIASPRIIESANLSEAWGQLFLDTLRRTKRTRAPVLVSIADFANDLPDEDLTIRTKLDESLRQYPEMFDVNVCAMTIFPYRLWKHRGQPSWKNFHQLCVDKFIPRIKARQSRNRLGTYFERMMNFTGSRGSEAKTVDQLGFIINLLKRSSRWPRESALQLTCFDPAKDHTGQPVRGFPCLQQVGLSHDGENRIALHAFYPSQYIFDRAYGNYLGLCHLGHYIACQTKLKFARLNVYVGDPQLGNITKGKLAELAKTVEQRIKQFVGPNDG